MALQMWDILIVETEQFELQISAYKTHLNWPQEYNGVYTSIAPDSSGLL